MFFRFFRWKVILDASNVKIPFMEIMKIFLIGFFFGTITPTKIGNLVKFHYLKKNYNVKTSTGLSLSLADRIFDLIVITLISIVGLLFIFGNLENIYTIILSFIIIILVIFVAFNERVFKRAAVFGISRMGIIRKLIRGTDKIDKNMTADELYKPFKNVKTVRTFIPPFVLSLLVWISIGFQTTVILEAMGYSVELYYVIIFMCLGSLVGLIPITASGFGIREGVFAFSLSLIGIPIEIGVLASLITFILGQLPPALVGLVTYIMYKGNNLVVSPSS